MFLALAVLLIQPTTLPQPSVTADKPAVSVSAGVPAAAPATSESAPATSVAADTAAVSDAPAASLASPATTPADLPTAPTPIEAGPINPGTSAQPVKNSTVSVAQLMAEGRHNQHMWMALVLAEHSAATFDAWSTRHAITVDDAHELNPIMKPFANNDSIYAALQAGPLVMDYLGKKMMYSRHSWVRRVWWVPQTASLASSIFCGVHNVNVRP